jgi:NAD-dependent SIR2 family protein deacetylase
MADMVETGAATLSEAAAAELGGLAARVGGGSVVVLSGAGISTESGFPDYRGRTGAARRFTPMTHQAFVGDSEARRRYWARSHVGWQALGRAAPNAGHRAVAALEHRGIVLGTITQNVDGLHTAAEARNVIDLHGRMDRVICLWCGDVTPRTELSGRLRAANAGWLASADALNPDGDAELPDALVASFEVVGCRGCGGVLMPDVVYFGGTVPPDRVAAANALVDRAALVLVLGSSLTVLSGRRFVTRAARAGTPIAIVNEGATRCDDLAAVKLDAPLGVTLTGLVQALDDERAGAGAAPPAGR